MGIEAVGQINRNSDSREHDGNYSIIRYRPTGRHCEPNCRRPRPEPNRCLAPFRFGLWPPSLKRFLFRPMRRTALWLGSSDLSLRRHQKAYGLRSPGSFEARSALDWGRLPTVLARRARPAVTQAYEQPFTGRNRSQKGATFIPSWAAVAVAVGRPAGAAPASYRPRSERLCFSHPE
jgi:hypothetical protein